MKPRAPVLLLVLALGVAAGCVRLGVWQLDRLSQKRARNAEIVTRLAAPTLELNGAIPLGDSLRYRRVRAAGTFDFPREVAIGSRSRAGNPGVHIATPLLLAGHDTLLLVMRGWAASPDAWSVDFARWHEPAPVQLDGYLMPFDDAPTSAVPPADSAHTVRWVDRAQLEHKMRVHLAPYFVMMTAGGASGDSAPARMPAPSLDEGPHFSYAVQWFLFATIFGAGGVMVVLRGRKTSSL